MRGIFLSIAFTAWALTGACQGPPNSLVALPGRTSKHIEIVHHQSFPGGGNQLVVRVLNQQGLLLGEPPGLELRPVHGGELLPAVVQAAPLEPGHTTVVMLPPRSAAARAEMAAAVAAFVRGRPAGERIALLSWGKSVEQLAGFTNHRDRLEKILGMFAAREAPSELLAPAQAVTEVLLHIRGVGGAWNQGARAVVVVGEQLPAPVPVFGSAELWHWVVPSSEEDALAGHGAGRMTRLDWAGGFGPALAAVSQWLDTVRQSAYWRVSVCLSPYGQNVALLAPELGDAVELGLPASLVEERDMACNPQMIAAGERTYPEFIALSFTDEQRAVYDQLVEAESKQDFTLSVQLGSERAPTPAEAHLRGKGSLGCERKSYTLNLGGKRPRFAMPRSATDEFYLLSLCLDDRYIRQHAVLSAWQRLGLFPMEFRYIELLLDGESRGPYLLVEKVEEELMGDNTGIRSIIRRGFSPPDTTVEVKAARGEVRDAVSDYEAAIAALERGSLEALEQAARARMDLDGYLTWLASNSLLENGDYVDEVWLLETDALGADGTVGGQYSFAGWDPEDVFGDCHYEGRFAVVDDYGLTYCAEAEWDHALLADGHVFALYVEKLEALLDGALDEAVWEELLADTERKLISVIQRPGVAPALLELLAHRPDAVDPEVAAAIIREAIAELRQRFAARAALLRMRVSNYRATRGW